MSFDSVCIVEHCGHELTMLDVHVLESVLLFFSAELVEESLLHVDAFNVEN